MLNAVPGNGETEELEDAKAVQEQSSGADKPWFVYPLLAGAVFFFQLPIQLLYSTPVGLKQSAIQDDW